MKRWLARCGAARWRRILLRADDTCAKTWLSQALALAKRFEGLRLHAYPDPASGGEPWTVGYGATGADIGPDTVWTEAQAEADLRQRMQRINVSLIQAVQAHLTPGQRAALADFAYNLGISALLRSTLLVKLNAGDYLGAADEFGRWVHACGKVMTGLVKRRAAERALFLQGVEIADYEHAAVLAAHDT